MAIELSGLSVEKNLLDLKAGEKKDRFIKINSTGAVPVLIGHLSEKQLVLSQFGAIMDYLLSEHRPGLNPTNTYERALCKAKVPSALSDIAVQKCTRAVFRKHA